MNSLCYKIVFSKRLGSLVAVGEHTSGQGKTASGTGTRSSVTQHGGASTLKASTVAIALSWLAQGAFAAGPVATALPTGASVNSGNVAISTQGAAMTIQQSSTKASVNWNSFNIGSAASVNVQQSGSNAVLLNRVVGNDPSQIFGKLSANGQVILINPNGVVFGQGGSVTASAFTASTFGLSEEAFASGRYKFNRNASTANVTVQEGASLASSTPGGYIALMGASVNNQGHISTQQGAVVMASGEEVALPATLTQNVGIPLSSKVRLEIAPSSLNAHVDNGGVITTEGGQVLMQAAALVDAVSQAPQAHVSHSGLVDSGGTQGGAVTLQADGGTIAVTGTIKASSTNSSLKGGDIIVGRDTQTGVLAKSTDVSGANLESQKGFIETSGEHLRTDGIQVKAGEWLLDPTNITIAANGTTQSGTAYAAGTSSYTAAADSVILASTISGTLNNGTSVTIATSATGGSAGNIAINESISKTTGGDANLTLKAHGDITLATGKGITSTTGKLNVVLNSDFDGNNAGAIVMNTGSSISSNGGNITLGGGTGGTGSGYAVGYSNTRYEGILLTGATINAAGGNISMKGQGQLSGATSNAKGVSLILSSRVSTAGAGLITLDGKGGGGVGTDVGVGLQSGSTVTGSATGLVTVTGVGGVGGHYNFGVWLDGTNTKITTTGGSLKVDGTGGGNSTASNHDGVMVQNSANLGATGAGTVTVTGIGGTSTGNQNNGVEVSSNGSITSVNGAISVTGTFSAGVTPAAGIALGASGSGGKITSTGNANITLTTDTFSSAGTTDSINAGTGTVTIQNKTAGTLIAIGAGATDSLTTSPKTLAVDANELGRITAGTLVIGRNDTTASGNVTINALNMGAMGNTSGNLTVLSGNDITLSGALTKTAGTDAKLTLTANNGINLNANITSTSNKLNVAATANGLNTTTTTSSSGLVLNNSTINANGGVVNLTGSTTAVLADQTPTNSSNASLGKGLTFLGTSGINAATYTAKGISGKSYGVFFGNGTSTFNSSLGSSLIEGTGGAGAWNGLIVNSGSTVNITTTGAATAQMSTSTTSTAGVRVGYNGGAVVNTNGNVTLGSKNNTTAGTFLQGTVNAQSGNLTLLGKNSSTNANGISMQDGGGFVSYLTGTNGAQIVLDGESVSGAGVNLQSAGNVVQQITASGTGASINITGVSKTSFGIYVGTSNVNNTGGNVTLTGTGLGSGTTQSGVGVNNAGTLSASGLLSVTGNAMGNNGIYSTGSFTSTAGDVELNAITTNIGGNSAVALNVQNGSITADQNVRISGTITDLANSNAAVNLVNFTATATKGTLSVDADTAGVTTWGTILGTNSKLITNNKAITVSTDSLALDTSATPATINAGTGTVTIQNKQAGVLIDVGGADVGNAATGRTLGINNNELNRITAGELVIGQQGTSASGNATVSTAITTNATTGNVTLKTGGNISLANSMTVGPVTSGTPAVTSYKNLTLNAGGSVSQTSAVPRIMANMLQIKAGTSIGSSGQALQTSAASVALQSAGDQWINEANGATFASTTTSGNVNITSNTDNISIGQVPGADGPTLSGINAGDGANNVNLIASAGSVYSATGNSDSLITANDLKIKAVGDAYYLGSIGSTGANLLTKVNTLALDSRLSQYVNEVDAVTVASKTQTGQSSSVNVTTGNGGLTVGSVTGTDGVAINGVSAQAGVNLTTGTGDLTIGNTVTNAASGNIVLAAGTTKLAGDTSSGSDVKTTPGKTVTNSATGGKTYIYTGSVANTGKLSDAVASLSTLFLSTIGTDKLNTVSHTAYSSTNAAAVSTGSNTQVFFREAIDLGTVNLGSSTVNKTYGDVAFANVGGLTNELITQIKANNTNTVTASATGAATSIKISSADLVDALTISRNYVSATEESTSHNLNANTNGYVYGLASNGKYTVAMGSGTLAKVVVNKLALTGSIAQGTSTYGDTLAAGAVTLNNVQGTGSSQDQVSATGVNIATAGNTSTSGNLKAGSYSAAQTLSGLTGSDADNYTYANVKGDYTVNKLALTGAAIADVTTTYATAANTGAVSFGNVQGTGTNKDVVNASATLVDAANSTSGNLKVGSYKQTASAITGADADNYSFAGVTTATGNYVVNKLALTGAAIADVTTTYATAANTGAVSFGNVQGTGANKDVVNASATLVDAANSTSGNLKAGSYKQTASAITGADADNYSFAGVTTATGNYVVNKLALTGAAIADVTTTYATAANTGAVSFGNVQGTGANKDMVNASATLVDAANSTSGNLKAGSYKQTASAITGADADNYSFAGVTTSGKNYIVNSKVITVSGINVNTKTYDGTTVASLTDNSAISTVAAGSSVQNDNKFVQGDNVVLSGTAVGTYDSKNVAATNNKVTFSGKTLAKADNANATDDTSNYTLVQQAQASGDGTITTKAVTLTGGRTYDGTTSMAASDLSVATGISINGKSEVLSLTGSGQIASKNVLTDSNGTVQSRQLSNKDTLALGNKAGDNTSTLDGLASNYVIDTAQSTVTITKRDLSLAAVSDTKAYDGSTNSNKSVNVSNKASTDTVTATQSFTNKNVAGADNSTLKVDTAVAIVDANNGDVSGNYNITTKTASGSITKKTISLSGITADNKVYDGNTNANITSGSIDTGVGTGANKETLAVSGSGTFDTKNAGTDKTVTVSDVSSLKKTNGSGDWSNYNLINTGELTTKATITKAPLTLLASTDSKTYDGSTSSNAVVQISGLLVGDSANATQAFASKNVLGTNGSTLQVNSGYVLNDGNNGNNYAVKLTDAKGTITPKSLTPTYAEPSKKMDGNTQAAVEASPSAFGVLAADDVTITQSATYDTPTVGTGKTVTVRNIALSGKDSGNYAVKNTTTVKGSIVAVPPIVLPQVANPAQASSNSGKSGGGASARVAIGDVNPFQLAAVPSAVEDVCSSANLEKCHCEGSSLEGASLCYEPK